MRPTGYSKSENAMEDKKPFLKFSIKKTGRTAALVVLLGAYMFIMHLLTGTSCVLRSSVGLPCPGCGMTRAYASLLSLDIRGAFFWHPMFWAIPVLFAAWLYQKYIKTKYPGRRVKFYEPLILTVGVSVMLVFIIRAVLLFPHTEPLTLNPNAVMPRIFRLLQRGFKSIFG